MIVENIIFDMGALCIELEKLGSYIYMLETEKNRGPMYNLEDALMVLSFSKPSSSKLVTRDSGSTSADR